MTDTNYNYGVTVAEFFPYSEVELQAIFKEKEVKYFRHCTSPAYPQLGVNVDWHSDKPLSQALNELSVWLLQGYTVATALNRPLYLKVQLRKPNAIIESDLAELAEDAKAEYQVSRYQRNVAETQRQVAITVEQSARRAEAAAAKQVAKRQATEEEKALADILNAYAKPAQADAEVAA